MSLRLSLAATCALTLGLTLAWGPAMAEPFAFSFPGASVQIGRDTQDPAQFAVAIAAFDGTKVPSKTVLGRLDQQAFRLDGIRGNTLALILPLQDQLVTAGYKVLFDCATTDCGGFDFRFALDVLAEPQMHVDLGDFRYLAAENARGDVVSLLVSRAADQGFVQVTTLSAHPAEATPAVSAQVAAPVPDTVAPVVPALMATAPVVPAGSLGDLLLQTGSVALDDLVFASGKAVLEAGDYASLAELADWLTAHPDRVVTVVGHTDATGTLAGNVALSKQRAVAVRDALVATYGVAKAQVDAQGAGYLAPRDTNQTPEGRQKNRRVEVMLTSTPKP